MKIKMMGRVRFAIVALLVVGAIETYGKNRSSFPQNIHALFLNMS